MRLLHLADLHIGKRVKGFSMLADQSHILQNILSLVENKKIDGVMIAGDVYDKAIPSAEAVQLLDWFLAELVKLKQKVFISSGNHDSAERLAFGSHVMKKAGVYVNPVFSGHMEPITMQDAFGELYLYMLPFLRPAVVRSVLGDETIQTYQQALEAVVARIPIQKDKRTIIMAHQFLTGAKTDDSEEFSVGGLENVDYKVFERFDYVALGHIHRAQQVGKETIRYSGTPLKYSFSEENHRKTVTILTMGEKGDLTIEEVELTPLHDMRTIRGMYHDLIQNKTDTGIATEDYVHIVLTDEEEILDAINGLRRIYPNLMQLEYDNARTRSRQEIQPVSAEMKRSPMELFAQFYELQNNQKMTPEQATFAERLLRQIGGEL